MTSVYDNGSFTIYKSIRFALPVKLVDQEGRAIADEQRNATINTFIWNFSNGHDCALHFIDADLNSSTIMLNNYHVGFRLETFRPFHLPNSQIFHEYYGGVRDMVLEFCKDIQ
jgi:hypothetical protein